MKLLFVIVVQALFLFQAEAKTPGYQANFGAGVDYPAEKASYGTSYLARTQLSTYSRFIRAHIGFSLLYGGNYLAGEGAVGTSIYPISSFTSEKATIHPFLIGQGVLSVSKNGTKVGRYPGFSYGVGVDWLLKRRFGISLSVQQFKTEDKSVRFAFDLIWFRPEES